MFTISVCLNLVRRLEVARYKYASAQEAIAGMVEVLTEWKRKTNYGVLVSAIQRRQ